MFKDAQNKAAKAEKASNTGVPEVEKAKSLKHLKAMKLAKDFGKGKPLKGEKKPSSLRALHTAMDSHKKMETNMELRQAIAHARSEVAKDKLKAQTVRVPTLPINGGKEDKEPETKTTPEAPKKQSVGSLVSRIKGVLRK